jgi:hypothetical protein
MGHDGVVIVGDVGEDARVVIDEIEVGSPKLRSEGLTGGGWWLFTDEQETVTADRVELASPQPQPLAYSLVPYRVRPLILFSTSLGKCFPMYYDVTLSLTLV